MDLSTFGDRKSDYIKLYETLGLPYRGESKDELKFNLMKLADKIPDEELNHVKAIPVAKKPSIKPKKAKVTELSDDVFKAKVEYVEDDEAEEEPEQEVKAIPKKKSEKSNMKPIKTVDIQESKAKPKAKAKEAKEAKEIEPKTEGSVPVKLTWNQFLNLKAKENPTMNRKDLMVKFSGKVWNDYKAQFDN